MKILPVEPCDAAEIINLNTLAMANDAYNLAFIPRGADNEQPADIVAWRISRLRNLIYRSKQPNSQILPMKVVHYNDDGIEKIVSYALWTKPRVVLDGKEVFEDTLQVAPESLARPAHGINGDLGDELYTKMERAKFHVFGKDRYDSEDFYILDSLTTLPEFGRRGVASMLVRRGFEMARAAEADVYIESTPAALALYIKLGARVVDSFEMLNGTYKYTCLLKTYIP